MPSIVIQNLTDTYIEGTYYGQPYKINRITQQDELEMLLDREAQEIIDKLNNQSN